MKDQNYSLMLRLAFAGLTFLLSIILKRNLNDVDFGMYQYVFQIGQILILATLLGSDSLLTKISSLPKITSDKLIATNIWALTVKSFIVFMGCVCLLPLGFEFTWLTVLKCIAVLFSWSFNRTCFFILLQRNGMVRAILFGTILERAVLMVFLGLFLFANRLTLSSLLNVYCVAGAFSVFINVYFNEIPHASSFREYVKQRGFLPKLKRRHVLLASNSVLLLIGAKAEILFMGYLGYFDILGVYAILVQIFLVLALLHTNTLMRIRKEVGRYLAKKLDRENLTEFVRKQNWMLVVASLILGSVLLFSLGPILELWKIDYTSEIRAASFLLFVGIMVNVVTGPAALFLTLMGYEKIPLVMSAVSISVLVLLGPAVLGNHGLIGAAFLALLISLIRNVVNALMVQKKLHFRVSLH